jgi:hypothetical protein
MDASIISAFAALTGATIGGLTSGVANWLNHRSQVRAQWLLHEKKRRQILYRDFIEEASRCYIDALQHHDVGEGTAGLVALYAKLNRSCPPGQSCAAPSISPRQSWIRIWNRTKPSASCVRWQSVDRSTCCANSARLAARNSTRCTTVNFDLRSPSIGATARFISPLESPGGMGRLPRPPSTATYDNATATRAKPRPGKLRITAAKPRRSRSSTARRRVP